MRTTLEIADDVFYIAKDHARHDKKTIGQVISDWARQGLHPPVAPSASDAPAATVDEELERAYQVLGIRPIRTGPNVITNEWINKIRDEQGI